MAKKLSYKELLSNLNGLTVRKLVPAGLRRVVGAEGSGNALCPDCGVTSHSRHRRYWRKLRDLPMQGASVTLKVQMGRWRCRSRQCLRQSFTERVDGVLLPHSQQTNRLSEVHRLVGRALGGRSGQRLGPIWATDLIRDLMTMWCSPPTRAGGLHHQGSQPQTTRFTSGKGRPLLQITLL
jgi:hypothetical protein